MAKLKKRNFHRNSDGSISVGGKSYGSGGGTSSVILHAYTYIYNGSNKRYMIVFYTTSDTVDVGTSGWYSWKEYNDDCLKPTNMLTAVTLTDDSSQEIYYYHGSLTCNGCELTRDSSYDITI